MVKKALSHRDRHWLLQKDHEIFQKRNDSDDAQLKTTPPHFCFFLILNSTSLEYTGGGGGW
jgi:hypothetical protein